MRKLLKFTGFFVVFFCGNQSKAQFSDTINVIFEKRINVEKLLLKYSGEFMMERMKYFDKVQIENFSFTGSSQNSLYKYKPKNADEEPKRTALFGYNSTDNVVYNDYLSKICTSNKLIYDEKMLVKDSLKKFSWHISNETRDILGYKCRKATCNINDTITVYAFYAQELLCTGGPEMFNGLPGMILGVAVPKLHTTWFATNIETKNIDLSSLYIPTKGKINNYSSLNSKLSDALKDYGKIKDMYLFLNGL